MLIDDSRDAVSVLISELAMDKTLTVFVLFSTRQILQ